MPSHGAHRAPTGRHTSHRRSATVGRVAIGALAIGTLLFLPQPHVSGSVETGCGTRWASRLVPPQTISVLRTTTGKVQTVSFRRYVAVVMASGEWPSRLSPATLEAGAVATKQFAWYYTLKGKHRPGYVGAKGVCYDVRDDSQDQVYRPEKAAPTRKQQAAIDKTWALTLRKNGRFFLTGYRSGSARRCAADANGWKLFALSVEACAKKGWSRGRIQRVYYRPRLTIVRTAHVLGPFLRNPKLELRQGSQLAARPARVRWSKISSRAPVKRYVLQRRTGKGAWQVVNLEDPKATSASVNLKPGKVHQFRVHAVDTDGERGPWANGSRVKAALKGPLDATLSGSSGEATQGIGGRARIEARMRSIAYVAPRGPNMGKAVIKVNGKRVKTVDLSRRQRIDGKLVWARNWNASKERVVVVKPARRDERVDIEGFLVLR